MENSEAAAVTTALATNGPVTGEPGKNESGKNVELAVNNEPLYVHPELLDNAERMFTKRLTSDPDNTGLLRGLAQVLRKQGKLDQAVAILERLARLDPADEESRYTHAILSGAEIPALSGIRPALFDLRKNFLPREFHESLHPYAVSVRDQFMPVASNTEGEYNPNVRITLDLPGKHEFRQRFRDCLSEILPQVLDRLHIEPFEIADFEVKLRAYQDGHFFKAHMDCPRQKPKAANRRLSFVYFFYTHPRPYTGGDLLLFDTDVATNRFTTSKLTRVIPEDNCLICFPSAYWHCVIPIGCPSAEFADSRFVINGHLHQPAPPADPAAPEGTQAAAAERNLAEPQAGEPATSEAQQTMLTTA